MDLKTVVSPYKGISLSHGEELGATPEDIMPRERGQSQGPGTVGAPLCEPSIETAVVSQGWAGGSGDEEWWPMDRVSSG